MSESVNGRTDGHWLQSHPISSPKAFGSDKLTLLYCFLLSEDLFTFTNSIDLDAMQHYGAFHLGLLCLQKYSFRGFPNTRG